MKREVGKKYYPKLREFQETNTAVGGADWSIQLIEHEWVYEFTAARHGGGIEQYIVTEQDFLDVKSGRASHMDVNHKYVNMGAPALTRNELRRRPKPD